MARRRLPCASSADNSSTSIIKQEQTTKQDQRNYEYYATNSQNSSISYT
jgi:hypothetical protein